MSAQEDEGALLALARQGDTDAFGRLVAPYRGELTAHCYRMLASVHDADDAVQDALLSAWRGVGGFEGRSSVRAWLYRIATHAALKVGSRRATRMLSLDYCSPSDPSDEFGEPVTEPVWIEPYPDAMLGGTVTDPAARYEVRESVELAFVAALQHLPATQRAVLILREVLAFPAAEVAQVLDTTVPAVNSALQRARATLDRRLDGPTQQTALRQLGEQRQRELVDVFVAAWERADVAALRDMLAEDARLSMPPLPVWFDGRDDIARFMTERMFTTPWRLVPTAANGQLAFACYQRRTPEMPFQLGAVNVLAVQDGHIADMTAFLDPADHARFDLPGELPEAPPLQTDESPRCAGS